MKIAIRYYTKSGNTKKLADAIGSALQIQAEDVSVPLTEDVDILFLGSSVYAAGVDEEIKRFIKSLHVRVGKVVNFSTATLIPSTYNQVKKLVEDQHLTMAPEEFYCRGSFSVLHRGRPNAENLKAAASFAGKVVNG